MNNNTVILFINNIMVNIKGTILFFKII